MFVLWNRRDSDKSNTSRVIVTEWDKLCVATHRRHTKALFQCFYCVLCLSQNPLLHGLLPQTEIPEGHQGKATMLLPSRAVVCQDDSYNTQQWMSSSSAVITSPLPWHLISVSPSSYFSLTFHGEVTDKDVGGSSSKISSLGHHSFLHGLHAIYDHDGFGSKEQTVDISIALPQLRRGRGRHPTRKLCFFFTLKLAQGWNLPDDRRENQRHFIVPTLSKSCKGLSRLRFSRLPRIGSGRGPGGKVFALWHLRQRMKTKAQSHRRMKDTNIVRLILKSIWLTLKAFRAGVSPASPRHLNVNVKGGLLSMQTRGKTKQSRLWQVLACAE